jgi:outer membrane receptor protein involved in Fe transport
MDRAYRSGIEISFSADIGALLGKDFILKPSISYTHMFKYKTRENPDSEYVLITGVPDDILSEGLSFISEPVGFNANLSISYLSYSYEADGSVERKAYMVADLNLKKRIYTFGDYGKISATFDVDNVSDETYYTSGSLSSPVMMPGRKLTFGLIYDY